jgi:hypothetical protein
MVSNRGCDPCHGWLRYCTSSSKEHVAPLPARPTDGSGASPAANLGRCGWDECCKHGVSDPKWNGTRRANLLSSPSAWGQSDEMRDLNICCWSIVSRQNRRKRVFVGDGGAPMSVSGLNCVENCLNCDLRSRSFFCDLSQESIEAFNKIKHAAVFP